MMAKTPKGEAFQVRMPDGSKFTAIDGGDIDLDEEVVTLPDGTRLTEARAAKLAEQTIREVHRRIGRPALGGLSEKGARSPQVSFRVPPRLAKRAEEMAAEQGKTLSQLGREALEKYLEESA
jgi:predicted HicB family RNase H-like nuclease